jgi:hypothetical protein
LPNRPASSTGGIAARPTPDNSVNRPTTGAIGRSNPGSTPGSPGIRPSISSTPSVNQPATRPLPFPGNIGTGVGSSRPSPSVSARPAAERLPSSGSGLSDMNNGGSSRGLSKRGATSRGKSVSSTGSRGGSRQ